MTLGEIIANCEAVINDITLSAITLGCMDALFSITYL